MKIYKAVVKTSDAGRQTVIITGKMVAKLGNKTSDIELVGNCEESHFSKGDLQMVRMYEKFVSENKNYHSSWDLERILFISGGFLRTKSNQKNFNRCADRWVSIQKGVDNNSKEHLFGKIV